MAGTQPPATFPVPPTTTTQPTHVAVSTPAVDEEEMPEDAAQVLARQLALAEVEAAKRAVK